MRDKPSTVTRQYAALCLCLCLLQSCVCTLAGCGQNGVWLVLVDEHDEPVVAQLEIRSIQSGEEVPHRCRTPERCDGDASIDALSFDSENTYEIRFRNRLDGFTPWQELSVTYATKTLYDFNGPGCDCSYDEVFVDAVVVPFNARMDEAPKMSSH